MFSDEWKKANVAPIHTHTHTKENDIFLPVCRKIFEHLRYNSMYKHIINNNPLSPDQSGFLHRRLMYKLAFVNYLPHFSLC